MPWAGFWNRGPAEPQTAESHAEKPPDCAAGDPAHAMGGLLERALRAALPNDLNRFDETTSLMKPPRPDTGRRRIRPMKIALAINALALVLVAVWFRCRCLENIPGTNGDEAWYGVKALEILAGEPSAVQTPTGNPFNPFFLGPVVLLHVGLPPSIALLRLVAVLSGMAALAINWLLCGWVFDRRTATLSTVILAVLPINIAYSRFAWDASQSVAATLPVLYCSLAAVRFRRQAGRWIAAAIVAQIVACLVHPTNLFAAAAIAAALATRVRFKDVRRIAARTMGNRPAAAATVLVAIVLLVMLLSWTTGKGPSRFLGRMGNVSELIQPRAAPHFSVLYARLFTGGTVYRYIPGTRSWFEWPLPADREGWGIDVGLFWLILAVAGWLVWRSGKVAGRREDRVLIAAWALGLAAFLLLAGTRAMTPGWERWAMCLLGPAVVLAARGGALCFEALPPRKRLALAAASLAGWLVLADFQHHYFYFIQQTGGRSHETFRTANIEPKRAALYSILRHRALLRTTRPQGDAGDAASAGETWIVTSQWWNYWPLRYLSMAAGDVRVVTPAEAEGSPEYAAAWKEGRVWHVEFTGSEALAHARADLAGRKVRQWDFEDFSGRPVLCVLHGQ